MKKTKCMFTVMLAVALASTVISCPAEAEDGAMEKAIGHNTSVLNLTIFIIGEKNYWNTGTSKTDSPGVPFEASISGGQLRPVREDPSSLSPINLDDPAQYAWLKQLNFAPAVVLQMCYPGGESGWNFYDTDVQTDPDGRRYAYFGLAFGGEEPKAARLYYEDYPAVGKVYLASVPPLKGNPEFNMTAWLQDVEKNEARGAEYNCELYPVKKDGVVYINANGLCKFHPRRVVSEYAPSVKYVQITALGNASQPSRSAVNYRDGLSMDNMNLQAPQFYTTPRALQIADNLLAFQRNCGGWDKNTDHVNPTTASLMNAATEKGSYGCLDNGATYPQLDYLARIISAGSKDPKYEEAFYRGLSFILRAQYTKELANGWPQYFPLRGGYHDDITFNDNAMTGVMKFLESIINKEPHLAFVANKTSDTFRQCLQARDRGLEFILNSQLVVGGVKMAWAAQYVPNRNYLPDQARSYEGASLVSAESGGVAQYLMSIKNPSPEIIEAIECAIAWFKATGMVGVKDFREYSPRFIKGRDRYLLYTGDPADMLWARFYEMEDDQWGRKAGYAPIYTARDNIRRKEYMEIPLGRRDGYSWVVPNCRNALNDYTAWRYRRADSRYPLTGGTGLWDLSDGLSAKAGLARPGT